MKTDAEFEQAHQRAHRLYLAGRFQDAIAKQVEAANHFEKGSERSLYHRKVLSLYLYSSGDLKSAMSILASLKEFHSEDVEVLENLGVIQRKVGQVRPAIENLLAAAELAPELSNIHDALAHAYGSLGEWENCRKHGERSLELKDAEAIEGGEAYPIPDAAPPVFDFARPQQQIIAFSLFGDKSRYLNGALANARLAPEIYPGWTCRFYVDETVPEKTREQLKAMRAEVVMMPPPVKFYDGLCWRFNVMSDPEVSRFLIRDADSVINVKERVAVDEWLAGDRWFHVMRDYHSHTEVILAGMWGGVGGVLPSVETLFSKLETTKGATSTYDQIFLRRMVWPTVRQSVLIHDSVYRSFDAKNFPSFGQLPPNRHIGQNRGR